MSDPVLLTLGQHISCPLRTNLTLSPGGNVSRMRTEKSNANLQAGRDVATTNASRQHHHGCCRFGEQFRPLNAETADDDASLYRPCSKSGASRRHPREGWLAASFSAVALVTWHEVSAKLSAVFTANFLGFCVRVLPTRWSIGTIGSPSTTLKKRITGIRNLLLLLLLTVSLLAPETSAREVIPCRGDECDNKKYISEIVDCQPGSCKGTIFVDCTVTCWGGSCNDDYTQFYNSKVFCRGVGDCASSFVYQSSTVFCGPGACENMHQMYCTCCYGDANACPKGALPCHQDDPVQKIVCQISNPPPDDHWWWWREIEDHPIVGILAFLAVVITIWQYVRTRRNDQVVSSQDRDEREGLTATGSTNDSDAADVEMTVAPRQGEENPNLQHRRTIS